MRWGCWGGWGWGWRRGRELLGRALCTWLGSLGFIFRPAVRKGQTCRPRWEGHAFVWGATIPLSTLGGLVRACMEGGLESWMLECPFRKMCSRLETETVRTLGGRDGQEWMLGFKFWLLEKGRMRKQEPSVTRVLPFLFEALLICFSLSWEDFFPALWPKLCYATQAPVAPFITSCFMVFLRWFCSLWEGRACLEVRDCILYFWGETLVVKYYLFILSLDFRQFIPFISVFVFFFS